MRPRSRIRGSREYAPTTDYLRGWFAAVRDPSTRRDVRHLAPSDPQAHQDPRDCKLGETPQDRANELPHDRPQGSTEPAGMARPISHVLGRRGRNPRELRNVSEATETEGSKGES